MEKGNAIEIDEEELARLLDGIPPAMKRVKREFSKTEDAFIKYVWDNKLSKRDAAKRLKISENTLRRRYSEIS